MISKYSRFYEFDHITRFRLLNAFIVTVGISALIPIAIDLKGEYLAAWVISSLMIAETLAVKAHGFLTKFDISQLYKIGMGVHMLLLIILSTFFASPATFIVMYSLFSIVEVAVFGAFSINLDVYQTQYYPDDVKNFRVLRNSVVADGTILGLTISALVTMFSIPLAVGFIILYHGLFSLYFLKNWNYIQEGLVKLQGEMDARRASESSQ